MTHLHAVFMAGSYSVHHVPFGHALHFTGAVQESSEARAGAAFWANPECGAATLIEFGMQVDTGGHKLAGIELLSMSAPKRCHCSPPDTMNG